MIRVPNNPDGLDLQVGNPKTGADRGVSGVAMRHLAHLPLARIEQRWRTVVPPESQELVGAWQVGSIRINQYDTDGSAGLARNVTLNRTARSDGSRIHRGPELPFQPLIVFSDPTRTFLPSCGQPASVHRVHVLGELTLVRFMQSLRIVR